MHAFRGAVCRGIARQRGLQAALRAVCSAFLPDPANDVALGVHAIRHYSLTLDDAREEQNAERPTTPWVRTGKLP